MGILGIAKCGAVMFAASFLTGCDAISPFKPTDRDIPAHILPDTQTSAAVKELPPPNQKLTVAVYEFPDMTGQHKPSTNFAEFSRAVTQGADAILVDVLTQAGGGTWFDVVERRGLTNILRERQIIQATRQQFQGSKAEPLVPMTFAGVLLEGGVVSYESNVRTGGLGARYLGIGAHTEYREDYVTVNLRMVSVNSGRVLLSVTSTKQIYSTLLQGNVFRFVSSDELLELDAGITRNAPPQFALREAIELGVFALIMEGRKMGLWEFSDADRAEVALSTYMRRNPNLTNEDLAVLESLDRSVAREAMASLQPVPLDSVDTRWTGVKSVD